MGCSDWQSRPRSRGLVFVIIGAFVVVAAVQAQSSEVRGLGGALQTLQQQSYGWILLAVTALGLFAFGLFGFIQAFYRRIQEPDLGRAGQNITAGIRSHM